MTIEFSRRAWADRPAASGEAAVFVALLALPWLWPFTSGPSPNVVPLLVTGACTAAAFLLALRTDPDRLRPLVPAAWLLAALASAVIGLLQWFGATPATTLVSPAQLAEAYGNLRQKNQFATLTSIGLAVLVFAPLGRARAAAWPALVLLAAANAASASRTGLLQWLLIAAAAAVWPGERRQRLARCAFALGIYALSAFALPALLLQLRGVDAANVFARASVELGCSSRKVLWANVAHLVAQRPWTGWGVGELDFAHYATLYEGVRFCDILDNAHNLPLHIAVELGLPAALAAGGALLWLVWRARPDRESDPTRQLAWMVLVLVGVHSLLEYPLWYGPFQLAVLLSAWLIAKPRVPGRTAAIALRAGAVGFAAVLALVYIEYTRVSQAYLPPESRWPSTRMDPVAAAGRPVLFGAQLRFAQLSILSPSRANAERTHELALAMLHYSPEPMVIQKVIETALLLHRDDEALWHAARYRAAFPDSYREWLAQNGVQSATGLPRDP